MEQYLYLIFLIKINFDGNHPMYLGNGTIMVLLFLLKSAGERPQHKFVKFRIKSSVPYSTTLKKICMKGIFLHYCKLSNKFRCNQKYVGQNVNRKILNYTSKTNVK